LVVQPGNCAFRHNPVAGGGSHRYSGITRTRLRERRRQQQRQTRLPSFPRYRFVPLFFP
jgi:hypothetical protein